ncbi:MAG: Gfo/Idh/MocA family oxidoreductase, partial [bacterium]|nr:Gfo/Idh/MocA family oxidoreductase [bacterium]
MDLNFAILGCGRIAKKHAEILAGGYVNGGRLAAVCDIKEDRARMYGENYGVPYFTDMHQMMESVKEIDVVNILTESGAHADNVVDLSLYGKHLVVEKPMALTVSDADRMIRACDQAGVRLFVV